MKKLMIIGLIAGLFLTGFATVATTPGSNKASVPAAVQNLPLAGYYMITNMETDWGIVEYRIQFTDCDGKFRDIPLSMKESIIVCLPNGEFTSNFVYSIERVK